QVFCSTLPFLSKSIGQLLGKQRKSNALIVFDLALLRLAPTFLKQKAFDGWTALTSKPLSAR
ncbi:hypothetical protein ACC759_38190, partial [Rhizobium ruizarguesonis]